VSGSFPDDVAFTDSALKPTDATHIRVRPRPPCSGRRAASPLCNAPLEWGNDRPRFASEAACQAPDPASLGPQAPAPSSVFMICRTFSPVLAGRAADASSCRSQDRRARSERGGARLRRQVVWTDGATQGGSSGAALVDAASRAVVGVLTGGGSSCAARVQPDYFGRLSTARRRPRPALAPALGGRHFHDGARRRHACPAASTARGMHLEAQAGGNSSLLRCGGRMQRARRAGRACLHSGAW